MELIAAWCGHERPSPDASRCRSCAARPRSGAATRTAHGLASCRRRCLRRPRRLAEELEAEWRWRGAARRRAFFNESCLWSATASRERFESSHGTSPIAAPAAHMVVFVSGLIAHPRIRADQQSDEYGSNSLVPSAPAAARGPELRLIDARRCRTVAVIGLTSELHDLAPGFRCRFVVQRGAHWRHGVSAGGRGRCIRP